LIGLFVAIPSVFALMEGATRTFLGVWLVGGLVILVVPMLNKLWKRIKQLFTEAAIAERGRE
jgi:hypothetical protein